MTAVTADKLYEKVSHLIPEVEWATYTPYIERINQLKKEKNAVILAHNYQTPEIFHGVADFTGDSLALAQQAVECDAEIIVLCGVHFMAETAKLLNPSRKVLIPDLKAGCSLAESITGEDVRALKKRYPGVPVVSYVNTSADVKAETDVCCTSSNAVTVVESLKTDRVLFLPDKYLAAYVQTQTETEIIPWDGRCIVHERFTAEELRGYRQQYPGLVLVAHPECPPDVIAESDMVGSTQGMVNFIRDKRPSRVALITECSMSDNVSANFKDVEFIKPCSMCPYMKMITLQKIEDSLKNEQFEVTIDPEIAAKAVKSVQRMLEIGRGEGR